MKSVKEEELEQDFILVMNKIIGDKEAFIRTLLQNIYRGLENVEQELSMEQIDARPAELQQELMSLVRLNAKTGRIRTIVLERIVIS